MVSSKNFNILHRFIEWILCSGDDSLFDLEDKQLRDQRVCSLHFPHVAFMNKTKKSLNCKAIPNLYEVDADKENNRIVVNRTSLDSALQNENHQSLLANYLVHTFMPPRTSLCSNDVIDGIHKSNVNVENITPINGPQKPCESVPATYVILFFIVTLLRIYRYRKSDFQRRRYEKNISATKKIRSNSNDILDTASLAKRARLIDGNGGSIIRTRLTFLTFRLMFL